jgi:hypothetical protein
MTVNLKLLCLAGLVASASGQSMAKGLDDLSGQNPEVKAEEESTEGEKPAAAGEKTAEAAPAAPVSYEGPLHQKLSFATSFGWVSASRSKGDWSGNGMSDLSVGFRYMTLNPTLSLVGTYRYAPINVVGEEDGHSYRGVWEAHYLGTRADYKLNPKTTLTGGLEAGYVLVYLLPVDGQETEKKHENNGVSITLGGGADFMLSENWAFSAGPRVYAGFGSFTTIQVGASAGFMF